MILSFQPLFLHFMYTYSSTPTEKDSYCSHSSPLWGGSIAFISFSCWLLAVISHCACCSSLYQLSWKQVLEPQLVCEEAFMPPQQKCHSKVASGLVLGCYSEIMSLLFKNVFKRTFKKCSLQELGKTNSYDFTSISQIHFEILLVHEIPESYHCSYKLPHPLIPLTPALSYLHLWTPEKSNRALWCKGIDCTVIIPLPWYALHWYTYVWRECEHWTSYSFLFFKITSIMDWVSTVCKALWHE